MYSNHHQAETTGVIIGRRQGHQQGRQQGYTEGWNEAQAASQARIDELQAALNAMFVLAYPALTTIHHSNDTNIQNFFVKQYESTVQHNIKTLRHLPHEDPHVMQYSTAMPAVVKKWIAAAHENNYDSPSP